MTRDEQATARVRSLIDSQHKHERDWFHGREMLIENQKNRKKAENQVNDLLSVDSSDHFNLDREY